MPDNEMDFLDKVLANDDTDYGDKEQPTNVNDDNNVEDGEQQPDGSQQQPEATQQQPNAPVVGERPAGTVPNAGQRTDPNNPNNFKRMGPQFADGKGNIVDRDGKIIAQAGAAARWWSEASRATAQVNNLTRQVQQQERQLTETKQIIDRAREISELPKKLGVSEEDYREGITLMSEWRRDPVKVAREIVARTLTFGHNLSDILGKSAGDAIEMKALTSMIKQNTAPFVEQQQQSARQAAIESKAQELYSQFVDTHENAEVHAEAIAAQMNNGRSPQEAYYRLRIFAAENQLDFSQPLGPQFLARQQQEQQPGQRQNTRPNYSAPMGNGNGGSQRQPSGNVNATANSDDSWQDIIRNAMNE